MGVKTILDVWASRWQSVDRRRQLLWKNISFHCFEPLSKPFSALKKRFSGDEHVYLHHYALGTETSQDDMYVSNIDDSSSLLPPTGIMNDTYQQIHFDTQQTVEIKKLDDIRDNLHISWPVLMKVDTQGFEGKVFEWAKQSLQRYVSLIVVELSFQEFYEKQPLFNEIYTQLEQYGFRYYGSFEQSGDPRDGRPLQQDAIFINMSLRS